MPRYSLDLDRLSADLASNQLSSSTLVQLLKENVDLEKTFGISAHFAETVRLTYEELRDASHMDECDVISAILCCDAISKCCESCCRDNGTSSTKDKKEKDKKEKDKEGKKSILAEVPSQEVMHDTSPSEIQPSLLERLSQLSSDDLQKMIHSKGAGKMEKFGMFLFKKKFGEEETKHMQECAETVKKVGPELVEKDKLGIDDLVNKTKKADVKAFAKLMRVLGTAFMAKHGQSIHEKGLDAVGLGSCAHVLCAGSMKYELDPTGLHKCVWTCPPNHIPDQFQAIGVEIPADGENETMTPSMAEAERTGDDLIKDANLDSKKYEKSSTFQKWNAMKFNFHTAYTEAPLRLMQSDSPTEFGHGVPLSFRYHGKCRPIAFELHERVVFTGSSPKEIPPGQLVKIERLPGSWSFKKKLQKDELEVKYKGKAYKVKQSDLHREPLAKLKVDEGVQDWMHSTGDTIQVSLPALHDPSRKQKDTLWFSVSSAKKEDKEKKEK